MKVTLTQEEIVEALQEYVSSKGLNINGFIELSCEWDQENESKPSYFTASFDIGV